MNPVRIKLEELSRKTVPIGREGENNYTIVIIDCSSVFAQHPNAVVTMRVKPPKGLIYPATIVRDGNNVIWTVQDIDLASKGDGQFQLTFTEGNIICKTAIGRTLILKSLKTEGPAPDPIQDWLEEAEEALNDLVDAEVHQPIIGEDGFWYKWNQEDGEYQKTNTKAQGEDGQDGHTPEKGVDYWTAADKAEMESDVAGAIIDDTSTALDKTWSASKSNTLLSAFSLLSGDVDTLKDDTRFSEEVEELSITWDENGDGEYIGADGTIGSSANFHYTNPIEVEHNGKYALLFNENYPNGYTVRVHGYDTNGTWVAQIGYKHVMSDACILLTISSEEIKSIKISIRKSATNLKAIHYSVPSIRVVPWDANGDGKLIGSNGTITESETFHYSELMEVENGINYVYSFTVDGIAYYNSMVHGYDANGTWVALINKIEVEEDDQSIVFTISNENIKYIRVSTKKAETNCELIGFTSSSISVKSVVADLETESKATRKFKLKVSSMGRIDDAIDSVKESGSEFEMVAVRKKYMPNNNAPVVIGWLYQRSPKFSTTGCELWYSANQMDKPKQIATLTGVSPDDSYRTFDISPKYGDIICCKRDDRNAPIVYDASQNTTTQITGLSPNPIGWQRNCGGEFALDGNGDEYFLFGEYTGKESSVTGYENVNIWKVTYPYTDPTNWSIVLQLARSSSYGAEDGKVWHVHTVMRDPFTGVWYVTTGDDDKATKWFYSTDDGDNWTELLDGKDLPSQCARLLNFVFEPDYIWWANDYGTNHSVSRMARDQNGVADVSTYERVAELNKLQSTYATAFLNYPRGLLMLDRVDTAFGNQTNKLTMQFYSFDDLKVHDLYSFKRMSNSPDLFFGFKCKCYTLRQSPYDPRIGVGFDVSAPNWVEMNGNADNSLWTVFFEVE